MKTRFLLILFAIAIAACRKERVQLTPEQKQKQEEQNLPLKSNELLEEEGLTFIVISPITDTAIIHIDLKLYKGTGAAKSATPITLSKNSNMNYSLLSEQLENNTEYTLTIEYIKVLQNAPYELFTEGFTSQYGRKELLITGKSFTIAKSGTSQDIMMIKKGILKFSVYEL